MDTKSPLPLAYRSKRLGWLMMAHVMSAFGMRLSALLLWISSFLLATMPRPPIPVVNVQSPPLSPPPKHALTDDDALKIAIAAGDYAEANDLRGINVRIRVSPEGDVHMIFDGILIPDKQLVEFDKTWRTDDLTVSVITTQCQAQIAMSLKRFSIQH